MTDIKPWPTLREFLDAGGDLSVGWPNRQLLVEILYAAPMPPQAHQRKIDTALHWSEMTLEESRQIVPGTAEERHLADCRAEAWRAEILAGPELAERVRALLTPEERAQGEHERAAEMSPHPIKVGEPHDWWRCQSCGEARDSGAAIVVGDREGFSHLDYEITYCRDCIAGVLRAYDTCLRP